jgi:hypothetical protein
MVQLSEGDTKKLPGTLDLAMAQLSAVEFVVHGFTALLLRVLGYEIRGWTLHSGKTWFFSCVARTGVLHSKVFLFVQEDRQYMALEIPEAELIGYLLRKQSAARAGLRSSFSVFESHCAGLLQHQCLGGVRDC